MLSSNPGPIGIFDSGYGGLTILHGIRQLLPEYDYLYLGDNARAPYGPRSFAYTHSSHRTEVLDDAACHALTLPYLVKHLYVLQQVFPVEAAEKLAERGMRLIAVGLGDESAGTSIMAPDEDGRRHIVKYKGEVVRSKLDSETLRQMVAKTRDGRYLPVATSDFDLGGVLHNAGLPDTGPY